MTSTPVYGLYNMPAQGIQSKSQNTGNVSGQSFMDAFTSSKESVAKTNSTEGSTVRTEVKSSDDKTYSNSEKGKTVSGAEDNRALKQTSKEETKGNAIKDTKVSKVMENEDVSEDDINSFFEAVCEVINTIMNVLSVSREDIENALSELNINPADLLDTTKIPDVLAFLSGTDDPINITMDEDLYSSLLSIDSKIEDVLKDLSKELNISSEEILSAIKGYENEEPVLLTEDDVTASEAVANVFGKEKEASLEDKVVVNVEDNESSKNEVKKSSEISKASNKEEAIETESQTKEVISLKKPENDMLRKDDRRDSHEGTFNFLDRIIEKTVEAFNEPSTVSGFSEFEVRNIINQLTEAIKINVSAENSEVNLKLHPESLGTVSVKVSANHEGVLTAEFTAQNESVKAIIESQAMVLKETLSQKGVTVEAIEVLVESHEFEKDYNESKNGGNSSDASKKKGIRRINLSEDVSLEEEIIDDEKVIREMMEQNGNTIDYSA